MLGLDPRRQTLGLFPGSRAQEVKRHWAIFREAAARVATARPDVQIIVAGTAGAEYPDPGAITVHMGDPLLVFAAADAGICKSGTTTLEAAIADLPMVITYRVHPISSYIAFRLLQVPWVGLVNLVAGYEVAPEFLQRRARAEALADGVLPLLDAANPVTRRQREGLQLVRDRLGAPGAADRVAELAAGLIR
jgi:lipid-A-disaccharide synthase